MATIIKVEVCGDRQCPFSDDGYYCNALDGDIPTDGDGDIPDSCPLRESSFQVQLNDTDKNRANYTQPSPDCGLVPKMDALIAARNKLFNAKQAECTCHGMGLQVDGCTCGKKENVKALEIKFWAIMETIEAL